MASLFIMSIVSRLRVNLIFFMLMDSSNLILVDANTTTLLWSNESSTNDIKTVILFNESSTTAQTERSGVFPASNRITCTLEQEEDHECFNGGTCFALQLPSGKLSFSCRCTPEFQGSTCLERYYDTMLSRPAVKIGLISSVAVVFLALVIIAGLLIWRRLQTKRENGIDPFESQQDSMIPNDVSKR